MFCATLIVGTRENSWNTMPIPALRAVSIDSEVNSSSPSCTVQDFHQRRFAGTVSSCQCMDFATTQIERDIVQHADPGKLLMDMLHMHY